VGCGLANDLLPSLSPGSVRLVCTSPRFWDRVSYERAAAGDPHPWQAVGSTESLGDYIEEHLQSAALLYEICAEDACLCLEVQDCRAADGEHGPLVLLADYWRQILQATGWRIAERITIERDIVPGRGNRSGHFVRHRGRPGYFLPDSVTSDLIVAWRGDPLARLRRDWDGQTRLDLAWAQRFLKNLWRVHVAPRRKASGAHPCPMSRDLVRACVLLYSAPGDLVLDPWAGEGTVGEVAAGLGRPSILIEKQPEWAADVQRRLAPFSRRLDGLAHRRVFTGCQFLLPLDERIVALSRRAFGPGRDVTERHRAMARELSAASGIAWNPEMVAVFLRSERNFCKKTRRAKTPRHDSPRLFASTAS
jgi:hypothetical protein